MTSAIWSELTRLKPTESKSASKPHLATAPSVPTIREVGCISRNGCGCNAVFFAPRDDETAGIGGRRPAQRGRLPLMVPGHGPEEGGQIPHWPEEVAYFFTLAAVEHGFIQAPWTQSFCGCERRVYVRLMSGAICDTGLDCFRMVMEKFDGLLVALNQSVMLRPAAASAVFLKGKNSHVEVEFDNGDRDCLCVSRRHKKGAKRVFGLSTRPPIDDDSSAMSAGVR